ncbi:MAG TPA: hypothetical protein VGJ26_10910 [Pirellulales bacterium]|jgi:hypothetical protein
MSGAEPRPAPESGEPRAALPRSNPFSTRFIQPGAIPYFFPPGVDAAQLVLRLEQGGGWGEIIGPHGSGKSTLLAELFPRLSERGKRPLLFTLHNGERSLARHRAELAYADAKSLIVVDGYEQLWPWNRALLRRFCRRRGAGLIVTAHAPMGLPRLYSCAVDRQTAAAVLERLLPIRSSIGQADLERALATHGQNLREALFELYDLYELRQPSQGA